MKTIAILNQKGGVGKTTTTMNLGAALARSGKRVLLVDADAQGNLSSYLGCYDQQERKNGLLTLIIKEIDIEVEIPHGEGILTNKDEGVDFIPASEELSNLKTALVEVVSRETLLRRILAPYKGEYDYCLIDCNPSMDVITVNAMTAADSVIIPIQPDGFAITGLQSQMKSIQLIRRLMNPNLVIEGILLTMTDKVTNLSKDVIDKVRNEYGDKVRVLKTEIPRDVKMRESALASMSIFRYAPKCRSALAYGELYREVKAHEREQSVPRRSREAR